MINNFILLFIAPFIPGALSISGVVVRPFEVILLLTSLHVNWRRFVIVRNRVVFLLLLFTLLQFFSVTKSGVKEVLFETLQNLEILMYLSLFFYWFRENNSYERLIQNTIVVLFVYILAVVIYHFFNGAFIRYKLINEAKTLFGILLLIAIERRKMLRLLFILTCVFLIFSLERKAWVGTIIAIILIGGRLKYLLNIRSVFSGAVIFILFTIVYLQLDLVRAQINSIFEIFSDTDNQTNSNASRLFIYDFALRSFLENPILGIGVNNFKDFIDIYAISVHEKSHGSHNEYLRVLVEHGLLGLSIILTLIIAVLKKLKRIEIGFTWLSRLVVYGLVVNLFLGAGLLNKIYFFVYPALLLEILKYEKRHS